MKFSENQYAEMTGLNRATVRKRLSDLKAEPGPNRAKLYNSQHALPMLYGLTDDDGERLDAQQEKAKLDKERRLIVELERAKIEGRLVDIDDVAEEWEQAGEILKSRLLGMPSRLAPMIARQSSSREIEDALLAAIHEALTEAAVDCDARAGLE